MGARLQEQYVTIAQSATVSSILSIKHAKEGFISAPSVNSCLLHMQASFDTTSANFHQVTSPDGSTKWTWHVENGNKTIPITGLEQFPYLRFETDVSQTDVRTFTIGVKL